MLLFADHPQHSQWGTRERKEKGQLFKIHVQVAQSARSILVELSLAASRVRGLSESFPAPTLSPQKLSLHRILRAEGSWQSRAVSSLQFTVIQTGQVHLSPLCGTCKGKPQGACWHLLGTLHKLEES